MEKLTELLPILEIDNDCIVSKMGEYTVAFEVTKPEIFTLAAEEFESMHQAWVKAISLLPYGSIVHMQDWYTESCYQADFKPSNNSFLSRASEIHFHERPYLDHRAYLFLTKKQAGRKPSGPALSTLFSKTLVPEETLTPAAIMEFLSQAGQFERILVDSGFLQLRRLTTNELAGNDKHPGIIEQYCQLSRQDQSPTLRDISTDKGVQVGDHHTLLYTLADVEHLPGQCSSRIDHIPYSTDRTKFSLGFASPLGQLLPCNHIYNQYIIIDDPKETVKKLELKRRRLQSLSTHSRENALAKEAVDHFLDEFTAEQRTMVKAHFSVYAWTNNTADVKDLSEKISSAIARMGAVPHLETVVAPQLWWAAIPGNAADLPMCETFDTFAEQAACFLISETNYRSSTSSFGIRLGDRITGNPIHVDISDEPMRTGIIRNRSKFVLGGSGSGKSFLTNHLMRCYHEQGAHILIIDIGNSYWGLCQLVEGCYFTYTEEKPISFNPFWMPPGESLDIEKKESIKTLLVVLWKKDDEAFLRSEYVALSNALQLYYAYLAGHPEIFPCFNSFYEFLQEQFVPILANDRVKEKDFDINNFLYVLRPFYKGGEYHYLLNADTNMDLLHQRFIVFELDVLKNHPILFGVITIIIAQEFISKIRKLSGVRKVILIEEAWKAIARQGMSEYIQYLFKTVRKFFGEAIVVTQEIEDIVSSPVVKHAIINNADCKILLDQSKFQNKFDQIQDLLGLTEKDKTLVLSVNKDNDQQKNYKEVFISLGNGHSKVYRTEVSLEEYLTYTTEESEKVMVKTYVDKYGSYRKGIAALTAHLREEQKKSSTEKSNNSSTEKKEPHAQK